MTVTSLQEMLKLAAEQHQAGNYPQAEILYQQALDVSPDYPDTLHLLGILAKQTNRLAMSETLIRKAISINPSASMHCNLGVTLEQLGKFGEAIQSYKDALKLKPDYELAQFNLGNTYFNLGNLLKAQGRLDEAIDHYQQAIASNSEFSEAHFNLGICYQEQGKPDFAITHFRHSIRIKPSYVEAHSSLIFSMDMHPGLEVSTAQQERKQWAMIHADCLTPHKTYPNNRDTERKLRIGYVSADFRKHSAACIFGVMLSHYDKFRHDIYIYSNSTEEDSYTRLIQQNSTVFKNITYLNDDEVATLIREDEIDILVDLSGHSKGNRLLVFARKPAPIQITAWGYIGGTGMQVMDVFFADPVVVPPQEKLLYAEQVIYLPCAVGYFPLDPFPLVSALPALSAREITFGSFNRLAKVTQETLEIWAQVLLAVPNSKMIIKAPELDQRSEHSRILETLSRLGVACERLVLQGKTPWNEHMMAFNQVDIALDPFPHGGGVTTLESLMMGVPVITLKWPTLCGRLSASIMTTMQMADWIAETPGQYVNIAVSKSDNLSNLSKQRQHLRSALLTTFAGDAYMFTTAVEQFYRKLWQQWCQS